MIVSGKNLKKALKGIDLTQEEIAKKLGVTRQTMSKWFHFEKIDDDILQNVKSFFNIDFSKYEESISNTSPLMSGHSIELYEEIIRLLKKDNVKLERENKRLQDELDQIKGLSKTGTN